MPDGLAVSPDGRRLYVALGGRERGRGARPRPRASASGSSRRRGTRPTSTSPGRQAARDHQHQRPAGPEPLRAVLAAPGPAVGDCIEYRAGYSETQYGGTMTAASVQVIDLRDGAREAHRAAPAHAAGAAQQPRRRAARAPRPRRSSAIRHVIYVIKENRTYDQVLRRPRQGRRRPGADAVQRRLRAQPPRARAPVHAARQLLRRRRGVGQDGQPGRPRRRRPTTSTRPGRSPTPGRTTASYDSEFVPLAQQFVSEPLADDPTFRGRGGRDARLPVGQRVRARRLVPRLRRGHAVDDPDNCHGGHRVLRPHPPPGPLRRPRRRALPRA